MKNKLKNLLKELGYSCLVQTQKYHGRIVIKKKGRMKKIVSLSYAPSSYSKNSARVRSNL